MAAGDPRRSGNDRLNLGDAAAGHTPIVASISFAGGAGDDRVTVYDLDPGGELTVHGGAGS